MPITYRIEADSADELAEPLRKVAKQDGNKFVVSALPEGFALEDVRGLKSAHEAEKARRREAEELAKQFVEAGLTREKAKLAAEALSKMEAGSLKSSNEIEAWKAEASKKHAEELSSRDQKLAKRGQALREQLVRGRLAPIVAAKGGSESMDAIIALAERNIRVEEDSEGNLIPTVVGDDGKTPRTTKKVGSLDPMGFEELIDCMRESPATKGLFRAQAAGGSGGSSQSGESGRPQTSGQRMSARELLSRAHAKST